MSSRAFRIQADHRPQQFLLVVAALLVFLLVPFFVFTQFLVQVLVLGWVLGLVSIPVLVSTLLFFSLLVLVWLRFF